MNHYDANFYASQSAGSYRSATMVVPHIINLYKPSKIADIGGGGGAGSDNGFASGAGGNGGGGLIIVISEG